MRRTLSLTYLILPITALVVIALYVLANASPVALAAPRVQVLPTAEPCAPAVLEPTSSISNARSGPGPNYAITGELYEGQSYPVAGRHHGFRWWAVTLPDGATAWVWAEIVSVSGNVAAVPLLEAPPLNGIVPDTEDDWTPSSASAPCEATAEATADLATTRQAAVTPNAVPNRLQEEWETPVNLSRSGGAANPTVVLDETGVVHAIWQEASIDSFVYAQGPADWSASTPIELPFGSRTYYPELDEDDATPLFTPTLLSDGAGRIHAFWIDDDRNLYHSSVASAEFTNFGSWSERNLLAESAAKLNVAIDDGQDLHIAYARSRAAEELPSGLYYLQSPDAGETWSEPALLNASSYFRTLPPASITLSLAATGAGEQASLFIGWDNRSLDQVYLIRSTDGGASWSDEMLIDSRQAEDPPEAAGPAELIVRTQIGQLHLLWRAGHEEQGCTLYHQWSSDAGETWQPRQRLPTTGQGCPQRTQVLKGSEDLLFVLATLDQQQGYIFAWNGERWSEPQREPELTEFVDAETGRRITFQWLEAVVTPANGLTVIGPDMADNSDVWIIARPLGSVENWFPAPSVWSPPLAITNPQTQPRSPLLLPGVDGTLHAFWTQAGSEPDQSSIFYTAWDGERWSRPAPVLVSPAGVTQDPSVDISPDGRLFAVWQAEPGLLYFSQAQATGAGLAQDWSIPESLPLLPRAARSPQIVIGPDGTLYVAFSVTLNEGRGIYLMTSADQGLSWAEPILVFDAVAAGWEMIDQPRLALGADGIVHLLWIRYALPPQAEPLSLHYARSVDGGNTWSESATVDEGAIDWSALATSGGGVVQRLWRVNSGDRVGIWNDTSLDAGSSWERLQQLPGLGSHLGAPVALADTAGRSHFLLVTDQELRYLRWDAEGWVSGESLLFMSNGNDYLLESMAVAATIDGEDRLQLLYAAEIETSEEEPPQYVVLTTSQDLELPEGSQTPLATLPPSQTPEASPTATPSPTMAPTVVLPEESPDGGEFQLPFLSSENTILSLALSVIPVLFVVIIALAIGLHRSRNRR